MLSLWFESGEESLSVRELSVREGVSALFEVDVVACSLNDDLDLDALLGRGAALRITRPLAGDGSTRRFGGICVAARQRAVEPTGLSTYELRLAPPLWLLGERTNHRVFQHLSIPEIVGRLLEEWGIEPVWHIDQAAYPRLEYRVQHGESDLAFVSRLLEEVGIAYTFGDGSAERAGDRVVSLHDALGMGAGRSASPIVFKESVHGAPDHEYVTKVRLVHELRPGRLALRGFDFRRRLDVALTTLATAAPGGTPYEIEARLEQHAYAPAAFFAERPFGDESQRSLLPSADDRGISRAEESVAREHATRSLSAARNGRRAVELTTNVIGLAPGTVFSISGHTHGDLVGSPRLLATQSRMTGTHDGDWTIETTAVFADAPYRPSQTTPKPVVQGVESAVVVGPSDEEIHTDEFGRVRVQFPWDREGRFDDASSCWIRVSQGWAGASFGMIALPRVGQEVVVGFFGGDPDQPIIVGRMFNVTSPTPLKLPENKTSTTWRSASTPGGGGWNEISFEDMAGQEKVYVQAERDLEKVVKANETESVGGDRSREVGASESVAIGLTQTIAIGGARSSSIGGSDETAVGGRYAVQMAPPPESATAILPTGLEMVDRKITLTTGEATLTLEGPNITLEAAASILLNAAASITINGRADIHLGAGANVYLKAREGDLVVQGGPRVLLNPSGAAEHDAGQLPVDPPLEVELDTDVLDAEDEAVFQPHQPDWLARQIAPGGGWDPLRWGAEHEDFGYFHLGVMAAGAGIPLGVMMRQLGKRTLAEHGESPERGDPGNGLFGGKTPYGNEPHHHALMTRGAAFHAINYTRADAPKGDHHAG